MPLTTRGKPWRLRVWAGPKFVRPHWWGPWMMIWNLGYCGPSVWNPSPPMTFAKQHLFFFKKKKKKKPRRKKYSCCSQLRATFELNRVVTSLDSSGSVTDSDQCSGRSREERVCAGEKGGCQIADLLGCSGRDSDEFILLWEFMI